MASRGALLGLLILFASQSQALESERRGQLLELLHEDCGSCHGMTLQGGLGPAITAEALRDKPRELILETILSGRPGTPMAPWAEFMTRQEAQWLVDYLYGEKTSVD